MKILKLFTLITCSILLIYLLIYFFWIKPQKELSTTLTRPETLPIKIDEAISRPEKSTSNNDKLSDNIISLIKTFKGTYAFYFRNLKTNQSFTYNKDKTFGSASLYKLWVAAAIFNKISEGDVSADQQISQKISVLLDKYNVDSSYLLRKDEILTFTVSEALEKMITVSDNDAALVLTDLVGISYVSDYLIKNGYLDSNLGTIKMQPQTTAHDIGVFLERLYDGQVVDTDSSNKILDLMKRQKLNNKLPLGLPDNIVIAHKTVELDGISHDAGIVFTEMGDYVIVVLSDTDSQKNANIRIAEVSKLVYEYVVDD